MVGGVLSWGERMMTAQWPPLTYTDEDVEMLFGAIRQGRG
jgi:hypothetical protein